VSESRPTKTADYNCAYVTIMAVLIIFPAILQTDINVIMLSIGGQGRQRNKQMNKLRHDAENNTTTCSNEKLTYGQEGHPYAPRHG